VAELLASRDRPTAFVPGTEALTPAVLAALAAAGLEVPRDASVCGFGDSLWEQAFRPPISVVRFDYQGVARAMIENVIARIEGVQPVPPVPAFPSEFVERGSCAPPPRRSRRRTA
jgi:LacI family transcriptional regulator